MTGGLKQENVKKILGFLGLAWFLLSLNDSVMAGSNPTQEQLGNDATVVRIQRQGLSDILDFMKRRSDLFPEQVVKTRHLLSREQKEVVWTTWIAFLDHLMMLEAIEQTYIDESTDSDESLQYARFQIAHGAFLARYRFCLDFLVITERDPLFHVILNEAVPELGLGGDTYSRIKYRYLHLAIATKFAAWGVKAKRYDSAFDETLEKNSADDRDIIWRYGRGQGVIQTLRNGAQIVKDTSFEHYFPIQKGISDWMGDVKVLRAGRSLINQEQISDLVEVLQPGDVLLERREWYLSNIGLPGFWPHAALYVGTSAQRQAYFQDPQVIAWVRAQGVLSGSFEALLQRQEPTAYEASRRIEDPQHPLRILEAVGEGVMFTTLEHSAHADSLAVLRPKLSKLEKAKALLIGFHYSGRPYDFNFDFLTDDKLVCTELVYKAYEGSSDRKGIRFPTVEIMGRLAMPANEIVKQFDHDYATDRQQFELIRFLDGHEREQQAVVADLATFRKSWKRPKWHILVQDTVLGER